ncbi:MAG: GNAT family N-acetyltransferase, partial [Candidatus Diapherotrites archaeon]|nr:GNAT family N-acetyltransferase [Candidatus Diapherotrites archaeon]
LDLKKVLYFHPKSKLIRNHFRNWAINPLMEDSSRRSQYAEKTGVFRKIASKIPNSAWHILDPAFFGGLIATRRNGLVFERDGKVIAHVIFQRHGNALHMFSLWVKKEIRGQGAGTQALEQFLEYARNKKGIKRVRLGGGGDDSVIKIWKDFSRRADNLKVKPKEGYWLEFVK